jgi:hypothetical protein
MTPNGVIVGQRLPEKPRQARLRQQAGFGGRFGADRVLQLTTKVHRLLKKFYSRLALDYTTFIHTMYA